MKISAKLLGNHFFWSIVISSVTIILVTLISLNISFSGKLMEQANLGVRNVLLKDFSRNTTPNKSILLVKIDDKTLSEMGRWQDFKRSYYAKVIDNLKRDGAIVIGIDVLFSEKSAEDTTLTKAIKDAENVVLGFSYHGDIFPIKPFMDGVAGVGYFDPVQNSVNSAIYEVHPTYKRDDTHYEAFSFAILRKYLDIAHNTKTSVSAKNRISPSDYLFHNAPFAAIPYSDYNGENIGISYLPNDSKILSKSFVEIYNEQEANDAARDKIVLIGATAAALHDEFFTPLGIQSGIMMHANMINTILNQRYITNIWVLTEVICLAILTFLLTLIIFSVKNRIYEILLSVIYLTVFALIEFGSYWYFGSIFNFPIQLFFIIIFISLFTIGYKYMYEEKGKRLLKNTLSQYLSEDLVMSVLNNYEEVKLGGTRREITTFFSDIAGFTSISENMEPEELVAFLSIYLKEVSDLIMYDKGFINKYEWDAVMAIWGAFWEEKQQALLACKAALAQQKKIEELNAVFKRDHGFEISVRMGINKGVAVVGNIGSQGKKIEYTALGDSVNTASRFEGINKVYSTLICVGESVMEDARDEYIFRKLDNIQVKGKEKPVLIYELVGAKHEVTADQISLIERFEEGLILYFEQKFEEAFELFSRLSETQSDGPSYTFMKRAEALKDQEMDANWTGAFRATEK